MSIIVTGGAGFIGSCLVRFLNDRGIDDIVVVDNINTTEKWKNLVNKRFLRYINKKDFFAELPKMDDVMAVLHLGACSSTTEKDFDYLWNNNVLFTEQLWKYCSSNHIPFIYASSAATYGDGSSGFDDESPIKDLRPLNGYGYSKQLVDLWAEKQTVCPPQHCGLKFFNVYGPNEYHKGSMASMVFHGFHEAKETGSIKLFRSYNSSFKDGEQLRDFVYVKDVCKVIIWLLDHPSVSGVFNIGTGRARSFADLARQTLKAFGGDSSNIEFVDMPLTLRGKYQYFTEAKMNKLKKAGYCDSFYSLEDGVTDYVQNFLSKNDLIF